jgi:SAM-dependent methyltransferase
VDFESAALQVAAEQTARDPRFHFQRTDVRTLHVDEPFDAVVAQHLLHQLDEGLVDAVRCMRTALRPRGRLILAQWPNLERCPAYAFIYRASGEYAEQAAKPVMTKERLTELVEQAAGLRIVKTELRTDFETPPRMPHDLLKQYVEGSLGWLRRDSETRRALQESPGLDKLADAYGRRGPDGFTFGLGMLVVVAERTDDRRAAQNVADGLQAHDINTARYSIAVPDNRRVDSLSCAPGPPTALVGERR